MIPMNKAFFTFLIFICLIPAFGQESPKIKNHHTFKTSYNLYQNLSGDNQLDMGVALNYNYGVFQFLEIGIKGGFIPKSLLPASAFSRETLPNGKIAYTPNSSFFYNRGVVMIYGLNANVHPFPYVIKMNNFRIDLYASFHLGLLTPVGGKLAPSFASEADLNGAEFLSDYGAYGGFGFYFFNNLGAYVEYGYGNRNLFKAGLTYKIPGS